MSIDSDNIYDHISADTLEAGDQTIVDGDLIRVERVLESTDIDEVLLKVENLSDPTGDTTISLFADDVYPLWSI